MKLLSFPVGAVYAVKFKTTTFFYLKGKSLRDPFLSPSMVWREKVEESHTSLEMYGWQEASVDEKHTVTWVSHLEENVQVLTYYIPEKAENGFCVFTLSLWWVQKGRPIDLFHQNLKRNILILPGLIYLASNKP